MWVLPWLKRKLAPANSFWKLYSITIELRLKKKHPLHYRCSAKQKCYFEALDEVWPALSRAFCLACCRANSRARARSSAASLMTSS
jgi:hypothetical protein